MYKIEKKMEIFLVCNVDDFSGVITEKVSSFAKARKRTTRGKNTEMINLEPLAVIEPKEKSVMTPIKRKVETSTPMGGKLMADAMQITTSSRKLASLRASIAGVSKVGLQKR